MNPLCRYKFLQNQTLYTIDIATLTRTNLQDDRIPKALICSNKKHIIHCWNWRQLTCSAIIRSDNSFSPLLLSASDEEYNYFLIAALWIVCFLSHRTMCLQSKKEKKESLCTSCNSKHITPQTSTKQQTNGDGEGYHHSYLTTLVAQVWTQNTTK